MPDVSYTVPARGAARTSRKLEHAGPGATVAAAAATSAVACFTDYRLTPRRLQPGFEQRLSTASLTAVYAAFAFGLAAGALAAHRRALPLPVCAGAHGEGANATLQ